MQIATTMNTNTTPLDPEVAALLSEVQETMSVAHTLTATEVRNAFHEARSTPENISQMHDIKNIFIPSKHAKIPARIYKPTTDNNLPVLVWFHGGGWVLGDLDSADFTCRELASLSQCIVVSVDYRLAPESPFPAAYNDCLEAVKWTVNNASSLGGDEHNIAVGGDSAGGNLAACVCLATRDLNLKIKFQLLIYPVIETDFNNTSYTENADGYFLTRNMMIWFWDHYVPDTVMRKDPRVAPLNAPLKDLPQAWLLTAGFDPLRDEGVKYAAELAKAGVPVKTAQVTDTVHGFFTMPIKCGAKARAAAAQQLRQAMYT